MSAASATPSSSPGRRGAAGSRWPWPTCSTSAAATATTATRAASAPTAGRSRPWRIPDLHLVFPVNKQGKKSGEAIVSDEFLPQFRALFAERNGCFSPQEWYDRLDLGKTLKGMISAREADGIIRKLSFKSFEADYKTVLVWLPETMNEEAANKILKILEEPWERTLFVLVSEQPDRLLPTILSRTQEVAVPRTRGGFSRSGGPPRRRHRCGAGPQPGPPGRAATGWSSSTCSPVRGDASRKEDFDLFCSLMRLSYNDRHLELIGWAEEAAQLSREQQRAFLRDAARLLRESYMLHAGIPQIGYLWGEELAFCTKFAPFVGTRNIEPLLAQIEERFGPDRAERQSDDRIHALCTCREQDDKTFVGDLWHVWYLLTGGNQGDVKRTLQTAQRLVNARVGAVLRCSHRYESKPWGFAAADGRSRTRRSRSRPTSRRGRCSTPCKEIERQLGRNRAAEALETGGGRQPLCVAAGRHRHPLLRRRGDLGRAPDDPASAACGAGVRAGSPV